MTNPKLKGLIRLRGDKPQHEIGRVIGVTQSQLHKFEQGTVRLDIHRAAKLARHFRCSIEDLL